MRPLSPPDSEESPGRALALALGAMAGVALLVGLAVGGALLVVLNVSGDGSPQAAGDGGGPESLFIPDYQPTESADEDSEASGDSDGKAGNKQKKKKKKATQVKLFVAPQTAGPGERINFNGVYEKGEGATLQVQRRQDGGWIDFPVTATVRGGVFETWIQTTRTGKQQFRMYDESADKASNTVRVTIR